MNKIFTDKEQALNFGRKHFKNYKRFNEQKLIFFYRLIKKIILNKIDDVSFFIDIDKFNNEINSLPIFYQKVLSMRYGENDNVCHTYSDIGSTIYFSIERARTINDNAIKRLRKNIDNYSIYPEKVIIVKNKTPLSELKLRPITHNTLIRAKIYTVEELMELSKEDLRQIYGIGKNTYKEIIEKLEEYKKKA